MKWLGPRSFLLKTVLSWCACPLLVSVNLFLTQLSNSSSELTILLSVWRFSCLGLSCPSFPGDVKYTETWQKDCTCCTLPDCIVGRVNDTHLKPYKVPSHCPSPPSCLHYLQAAHHHLQAVSITYKLLTTSKSVSITSKPVCIASKQPCIASTDTLN